jgi:hypothetical protein
MIRQADRVTVALADVSGYAMPTLSTPCPLDAVSRTGPSGRLRECVLQPGREAVAVLDTPA